MIRKDKVPITAINNINTTTLTQSSQPKKHNPINPASVTGYGALGCAVGSVIAIKNKSFKWHKYLAYAAGAFALAHVGIIEWFHHKK